MLLGWLYSTTDPNVHNALGKIVIDMNNNPKHFLTTNPYHDSLVNGRGLGLLSELDCSAKGGLGDNAAVIIRLQNGVHVLISAYHKLYVQRAGH